MFISHFRLRVPLPFHFLHINLETPCIFVRFGKSETFISFVIFFIENYFRFKTDAISSHRGILLLPQNRNWPTETQLHFVTYLRGKTVAAHDIFLPATHRKNTIRETPIGEKLATLITCARAHIICMTFFFPSNISFAQHFNCATIHLRDLFPPLLESLDKQL